ncbi:TadE/TadG family type IV pilus assembly protein [Stratiformator vulcanicus]|nr:pilus assembly protein [Stratiformator vulcanicus]
MRRNRQLRSRRDRRGATLVELAVVLPVFTVFLAGLMEINHAYMVSSTLKAACQQAARQGVSDNVSTTAVKERLLEILSAAIDTSQVTVYIKDGSVFDNPGLDPTAVNYSALSDINLSDAEPRQLFIVRAEVPYDAVSLLPPFFVKKTGGGGSSPVMLSGQSVMRHE